MKKMMIRLSLVLLSTFCFTFCAWPWSQGNTEEKLMDKKEIKELQKKRMDRKNVEKIVMEYWKWVKTRGDKESFAELQELSKKYVKFVLSDENRSKFLIEGAAKIAQTRGISTKKYIGNRFIVVPDDAAIAESNWNYYWNRYKNKSFDYRFSKIVDGSYPKYTFRGHSLVSTSPEAGEIPFITRKIIHEEFPDTEFLSGNKKILCYIDISNPKKLILAEEYPKAIYQNKLLLFVDLCQHYGAKSVRIARVANSKETFDFDANINLDAFWVKLNSLTNVSVSKRYSEVFFIHDEFVGNRRRFSPRPTNKFLEKDNYIKSFIERCENINNPLKKENVCFSFTEKVAMSAELQNELKIGDIKLDGVIDVSKHKNRSLKFTYTVEF